MVKNLPAHAGNPGSIPGRSFGGGHGNPLQTEEAGGLQSMGSQAHTQRMYFFIIVSKIKVVLNTTFLITETKTLHVYF